jgi:hypothetical protein
LFLDEMTGGRKHPGERPGLPIIMANGNSNNMDILYYNPDNHHNYGYPLAT